VYKVTIPHNAQGQAAIKFETEYRAIARAAIIVGKACGVETKIIGTVGPRPVKSKNL